jgi:methionine sulfoxide reductase heme-binding subunit
MLNKVSWQQALLSPRAYWVWYAVLATPFFGLVWALCQDALGANPAEALSRATGDWTLRLLCLVLAISPLRYVLRVPALLRFRRST